MLLILTCIMAVRMAGTAQPVVEKYMYVDSPEGLRVRKTPNAKSEVVYLLQNKSGVEVLHINNDKINLNGVMGQWVQIQFNAAKTVQGWVFSGYLISDVKNSADNWINCKSYKYRERNYHLTTYPTKRADTSAFAFIAKELKNYFYPKVVTEDFYLIFYNPLVRHIPEYADAVFDEADLIIEGDSIKHYVKFQSERPLGDIAVEKYSHYFDKAVGAYPHYIITVGQYKNDVLIKEMQFAISFFGDYIKSPELIDKDLEKRIKIIDVLDKDLAQKIEHAYNMEELCKEAGLKEETLLKVQIEKFDFDKIRKTDFSQSYIEVLKNNNIILSESEKEVLKRLLSSNIYNYNHK